jgi:hypothetical protein
MPTLHIVEPLCLELGGPTAPDPEGEYEPVFLRQGDLDGACGPYSLLICLLTVGLVDQDDLEGLWQLDKRSGIGKLISRFETRSGLIREGTALEDLESDLKGIFSSRLRTERCLESGKTVRDFVHGHLQEDHPVILGLEGQEVSHWLVVVGFESDAEGSLTRFLLLDPSCPPPDVAAWNGVLDVQGGGGRYPYRWWGDGEEVRVQMEHALAIWAKE